MLPWRSRRLGKPFSLRPIVLGNVFFHRRSCSFNKRSTSRIPGYATGIHFSLKWEMNISLLMAYRRMLRFDLSASCASICTIHVPRRCHLIDWLLSSRINQPCCMLTQSTHQLHNASHSGHHFAIHPLHSSKLSFLRSFLPGNLNLSYFDFPDSFLCLSRSFPLFPFSCSTLLIMVCSSL